MIRRTTTAGASALAVFLLSACGGGPREDPRAEIETAFRAFARAIVAHDGRAACARMTPDLRAKYASDGSPDPVAECAAKVRLLSMMWSEEDRKALHRVSVRRVRADGDRAELHDDDLDLAGEDKPDPDPRPIVWRRIDGKWLIAELN